MTKHDSVNGPEMKTRKILIIGSLLIAGVFALSSLGSEARADDELLDILGAGASDAAPVLDGKGGKKSVLRSVLAQPTAEQNIFMTFFDKGDFEKALYQWPTAFEGTAFAKSPSGRALNSYLLFRNGIQVTSLESLLSIQTPGEIAPEIVKIWREAAPDTHEVWALINTAAWQPFWTETFGVGTEVRVRGRLVYGADQVETLKELIKKTQIDTRERAWLQWQLVLALSTGEDPGTAAKALANLMKAPNNPVSVDLLTVTAARLLFQNGFLDASTKYYEKVSKSSDYWMDAQEEMGWAFVRKGEPQNAIAITKTLVNPAFASQVGPEPIFLRALAQLKICDYPEVVGTLNLFRDRFRDRAKALLAVSESAETPMVKKFISRSKDKTLKLSDLGSDSAGLPRFVTRDQVLSQLIRTEKALEKEGKTAGELYARSLTGGTGQVGFQARLDQFRQDVETRVQSARSATYGRIKSLAEEEVNEISQILQKLHIVEAELLQQISVSNRVVDATSTMKSIEKTGTTGSQARDRLWFPAEKETWFDELANYRVDVKKGCTSSVKR